MAVVMAHVITSSLGAVLSPSAVTDYESESEVGTLVHDIIDRPSPDATLRAAGTRSGRLVMTFPSEASAWTAESELRKAASFTWASPLPTVSMTFVPQGTIRRSLRDTGRWIVEIGYREVSP